MMEPDLIQLQNSHAHLPHEEVNDFPLTVIRMKVTDQVKELQTVLRDR